MYRIVDLFCGCGGISRGFEWTGAFGTEFGVELVRHAADAFAKNIKNSAGEPSSVYTGDIHDLADDKRRLWSELNSAGISRPGDVDVIVGGPPCQGFSRNGVRRYQDEERTQRFYDLPKNHLYKAFLGVVEELHPKLLLIENVREFLKFGGGKFADDLMSRLSELGYEADFRKVCAADFGVPQMRHRVLFAAVQRGRGVDVEDLFPTPKFFNSSVQFSVLGPPSYRTVRDAISDLPSPATRHKDSPQPYDLIKPVSELAELLQSATGLVHNHVARKLSAKQVERIRAVGTGRMKEIDPDLRTRSFYGSAYRRMAWDEPSLTITTWVYHVGSGRFAHPEEDRGVTMREAARIQTFDDDFIFPPLVNPVSQMIGNAVPPLLAHAFAQRFREALDRIAGAGPDDTQVDLQLLSA